MRPDGLGWARMGSDGLGRTCAGLHTPFNTLQANKSVFESVLYDSEIERSFADALERNESVKLYVKLPSWFKIPTPLGSYNPDWAVVVDHDGQEKLYFVVETKGSLVALDLRTGESDKIDCGAKHFEALAVGQNPANFKKAKKLEDVLGLHA